MYGLLSFTLTLAITFAGAFVERQAAMAIPTPAMCAAEVPAGAEDPCGPCCCPLPCGPICRAICSILCGEPCPPPAACEGCPPAKTCGPMSCAPTGCGPASGAR